MSIWNKIKVYLKNAFTLISLGAVLLGAILFICTFNNDSMSVLLKLLFLAVAVVGCYGLSESWKILEARHFATKGGKAKNSQRKISGENSNRRFKDQPNPNAEVYNEDEIPICFQKLAKKNGSRLNIRVNHNSNTAMQQTVQTNDISVSNNQNNSEPVQNDAIQNQSQNISLDEVPNFFIKMVQKSIEDENKKQ